MISGISCCCCLFRLTQFDPCFAYRKSLKACVVLFPLLGLTWIFGILTVTDAGLVFQYLFTIFNSLQVSQMSSMCKALSPRLEIVSVSAVNFSIGRIMAKRCRSRVSSISFFKRFPEGLGRNRSDLSV